MLKQKLKPILHIVLTLVILINILILPTPGLAVETMKPYLQALASDSVYVLAESVSAEPITVEYGIDTDYGLEASTQSTESPAINPVTFIHNIKLTGLEPETLYHYRLKKTGAITGDYTFKTSAAPGSNFRFAFAADFRTGTAVHDEIALRIKEAKPDFLLYGGDLSSNSSYASFKEEFFRPNEMSLISNVPFFNAPGNHEKWSINAKAFLQAPDSSSGTQDYYSFDYGDAHILVINNMVPYEAGSAQYKFAQNDLAATKKTWKIVISHNPAYCAGGHNEDGNMVAMARNIFAPNKVDMVISGHSHFYQHNKVGNIPYMVLGTAGAPFYDPGKAAYTVKSAKDYNYAVVDVTPQNFHMVVYNNKGKELDTVDLNKKPDGAAFIGGQARNFHLSWKQNKTDSTAVITWTSPYKLANIVRYGASASYDREVTGTSSYSSDFKQFIMTAELTGLSPDTVYHYSCGTQALGWSSDRTFTTAPEKGSVKPMRIGVFSDTQDDGDNSKFARTRTVIDRLTAYKPRFTLCTGDMVVNGTYKQSWINFLSVTEKLNAGAPLMPVAGNHDNLGDQSLPPDYYNLFSLPGNEKWYSYDYGNIHFTALYTGRPSGISDDKLLFAPGTEQYEWLKKDLEAANKDRNITWKIVCMHYPPYAMSGSQSESARKYLAPLMDRYGVDLVINGHRHVYERMKAINNNLVVQDGPDYTASPKGTVYVIAGPAGNPLQGPGTTANTAYSETGYAFGILEVEGKNLSYKAVHETGVVFDHWTIKK